MQLVKCALPSGEVRVGCLEGDLVVLFDLANAGVHSLADILNGKGAYRMSQTLKSTSKQSVPRKDVKLLAPIDTQEVWAAGVTYKRSQVARMEESESGKSHYDKV